MNLKKRIVGRRTEFMLRMRHREGIAGIIVSAMTDAPRKEIARLLIGARREIRDLVKIAK